MRRPASAPVAAGLAAALFVASPARAQRAPTPTPAAAESALARGAWDLAVSLASSYTWHHPDDPRGWMVLGKARLARPTASAEHRLQAIWAFRKVLAAEPGNLEAWDRMGRAALLLGGGDGEQIARDAFEHLLAQLPDDDDAWAHWLVLYRGRRENARMRRILARHDSVAEARARIARLLIEDERYDSAGAVLDGLLRDDPFNPEFLALRAQSAFEAGDTATGEAAYARALRSADRDDHGVLWWQVVGIASPAEIRAWEAGVPAALRPGFLSAFWARRNPDLFAPRNRRIAEHFARLRQARNRYPLLHPLEAYHRNETTRAAEARASHEEDLFYMMCEAQEFPGAPMTSEDRRRMPFPSTGFWNRMSLADQDAANAMVPGELGLSVRAVPPAIAPFARGITDIDSTAAGAGYNLRTGLDDRGIAFLRFGAPLRREVGPPNVELPACRVFDLERWVYPGIGVVRFFAPSAVGGRTGDMLFRPQNEGQFSGTVAALTRDATSVPAPLQFGMWLAEFANAEDAVRTDLAVFATRNEVAAQLVTGLEEPAPPAFDTLGLALLTASPATYVLAVNARAGDTLGRLQGSVRLRDFSEGVQLSSLVLAPTWADTAVDRATMLARAQRDLTFTADSAVRAYVEVYGLPRSATGTIRYRAEYALSRTDDVMRDLRRDSLPGASRLSFERVRPSGRGAVIEWLDLRPELLPPGRYLLRLTVHAVGGGPALGQAQVGFQIVRR